MSKNKFEPMVKLSSLKLNEKNPRTITKDAFEKLCSSVQKFPKMMALRGIVVDKDDVVIGGTQRYRACLALGMKEIPTSWVKDAKALTAQERKRFIIADNAPDGAAGAWDFDMLANEWEVEQLKDFGFQEWELGIGKDFDRVDASEQSRLDIKKPTICPKCGHEFTITS